MTQRERDVVRLVVDGMRNQEIALQLNLTEHTVRNYLIGSSTNWAYRAVWNWFCMPSVALSPLQIQIPEGIRLRHDEYSFCEFLCSGDAKSRSELLIESDRDVWSAHASRNAKSAR